MHYAETRAGGVPPAIAACLTPGRELLTEYPNDQWYVETGRTPQDGWAKIQQRAVRLGLVRQRRIGRATCMLMRAAAVTALYEQALRGDPYGLFGVPCPERL